MNNRYSSRTPVKCVVTFSADGVVGEGRVLNLSVPGCLIETSANLKVGQYLHLQLRFSEGPAPLRIALAVVLSHRRLAVPFALIATVLAFSRVYLSQHFPQDALAGSALGTFSGIAVHHWLYVSPFAKKRWLTRNLLRRQNQ